MSLYEAIYLGIDVGTSSVKAGFVSENGQCLMQSSVNYPTYYGEYGQAEQDAWDWWSTTTKAVQTLTSQAPHYAKAVRGISVSCQAPTLFGVDRYGQPVNRGMIWMDRRAEMVCHSVLKDHEKYIHQYSCNRVDPYYMLSKLTWQKLHYPDAYTRTECYLQINGWIVYQLTGNRLTDVTNANLTQLMNVYTLDWDNEISSRLDLDLKKLPPIVPSGSLAGRILPKIAHLWGVPLDTAVAAGCIDGSSASYGLGLSQEGDVFEMSGTSSGIGVIISNPIYCPQLSLMKHVQKDKWFLKGSTSCSGGSLRWYRDHVDQSMGDGCYAEYDRLAQESVPGANGVLFLPYLNGERAPLWDSKLRGVLIGFSSSTEKKDLLRAIMEGTAYALRTVMDAFPGEQIQNQVILGTGGGYRSAVWSQIKADVLECPIQVKQTDFDAAVLGSAFLALEAAGGNAPQPVEEGKPDCYWPIPENKKIYCQQYQRFCRLYDATRPIFHEEDDIC